ncbi:MAG: hypothetical protein RR847_03785 [Bacilli bacterium]
MKKSIKIILSIIMLFSLTTIGSIQAMKVECPRQIHQFYFIYPPLNNMQCGNSNVNPAVQTACDDVSKDFENNQAILKEQMKNGETTTFSTIFNKTTLKDSAVAIFVEPKAETNFTKDDYYMVFDANVNKNSLTEADIKGIYTVDNNGIIITQNEQGLDVTHHMHGSWSGEGFNENDDSIFVQMKKYYDTLDKPNKIAFREKTVNDLLNAQLPSTAIVGVGSDAQNFSILTDKNYNNIFDNPSKVAIQRVVTPSDKTTPMIYPDSATGKTNHITYITPAKVLVEIADNCPPKKTELTCEEVKGQYDLCYKEKVCTPDILAAYEKCNPVEKAVNPKTADLNIVLICLVMAGAAVLGVNVYRQRKEIK